jgi:heme exporter protein D
MRVAVSYLVIMLLTNFCSVRQKNAFLKGVQAGRYKKASPSVSAW